MNYRAFAEKTMSPTKEGKKMLRILLVVDGYYPSTGGSELQVNLLSRALKAEGHRVEIVAPWLDRSKPLAEFIDDVPVTRLAYPKIKLLGAALLCLRFALWLWTRRDRYDAIHVHMAKNLAAAAGLVRPYLDATLMVKISGAWEFNGGILDPALRGQPIFRFYNWCIRRADCLQCISQYTYRALHAAGYPRERLRLIPNAVDLERFGVGPARSGQTGERRHVVFVGRVEPVKGLAVLLDAWSGISPEAARLTIAGDGTQRSQLMQIVRERDLTASIAFPGEIHNVGELLATADIYVQPSFQEGLPNSVLEAMAAGLPVVATRISGNEDVVADGENGLLVPSGDPEALRAALQRLIADPVLAARMGKRSRTVIEERFSLPAVLGQLEAVYRGASA